MPTSSHLTGDKLYLSGGKDLKEVHPNLTLSKDEYGFVFNDKKGGHYLIFTFVDNHKDYVYYDIDNHVVDEDVSEKGFPDEPLSAGDPMTVYYFYLSGDFGFISNYSYNGDTVSVQFLKMY